MVAGFDEMIPESAQYCGLLLYPTPALKGLLRVKCASINHKDISRYLNANLSLLTRRLVPQGCDFVCEGFRTGHFHVSWVTVTVSLGLGVMGRRYG